MKTYLVIIAAIVTLVSCAKEKEAAVSNVPLEGTWQLLSETKIEGNDTTFSIVPAHQKFIKMLNKTHFSFLRHDLSKGKDSTTAVFSAGAGTYTLIGNKYAEHLEFFNIREWENNNFEFTVEIKNDTMVQQGREKVEGLADRIIIEKYKRVTN